MNILLYTRKWRRDFDYEVLRCVFPNAEITSYSEERGVADVWLGEYLYAGGQTSLEATLTEDVFRDVVSRDRFLVNCDVTRARRVVGRVWAGLEGLFDKKDFDLVYSYAIDCYCSDVCAKIAKDRGIPFVSFVASFIKGYMMFTTYGERMRLGRKVSDDEVQRVYKLLSEDGFLPKSEEKNIKKSDISAIRFYLRRRIIESFVNPVRRLIHGDQDNQLYATEMLRERKLSDFYCKGWSSILHDMEDYDVDVRQSIYFPLHYVPEASTSYWLNRVAPLGYSDYVCDVIERSDPSVMFYVKEHPAMFGRRELNFYERLSNYENVRLVHAMVRSNSMLRAFDNVLVDDGTVGVEALLRGKRVLSLEGNYYSDLHPNCFVVDYVRLGDLSRQLDTSFGGREFVRGLLSDMYPTSYYDSVSMGENVVAEVAAALRMWCGLYV
ncbi:hypothetical protein [Adlercreutzia sp. ZJ138]|uniref:hypothetical protein n=1 Tax=Adlercreutzia sp. ZJ138 TaxID=2709405 RepID=UPI0013EAF62B|nr:hypothetical protein [Adlercreutzia sp. ZJ138]